jgi:hypothetical protein
MSDPENPIASCNEGGVPSAVPLEGGAVMVVGKAVELDNEALLGPHDIDLEAEHGRIYRRGLKSVLATKADEEVLQCRAGEIGDVGFGEEAANGPQCPAAKAQLADLLNLAQAEEPESVGLFPRGSEALEIHHFREVEERPGDGGDRNLAANLTLLRWETAPMDPDSAAPPRPLPANRCCDVHWVQWFGDTPEACGAAVAQHRAISVSQHRRKPPRALTEVCVADGIDALVKGSKRQTF